MRLFKRRNKQQEREDERTRIIVREELESHTTKQESVKAENQRVKERQELWNSLPKRTKIKILRKAGKYVKKID
jgi:hypothetical protein